MKKINFFLRLMIVIFLSSTICFAQKGNAAKHIASQKINAKGAELAPNVLGSKVNTKASKEIWDTLFKYDVKGVQEAGVETDGNFIYTSDWNGAMFYKYSMTGTILDSFSINTVSGIRDMAFDGTYFYGGANSSTIYKMNFTNHTLVGTITCPTGTTVRNIAYDPGLGGFWVGGWSTDIICVSPTGTVLDTILSSDHSLTTVYGSAYDNWSQGGPYLWLFDQGTNNGAFFHQISLTTMLPTGVIHDCSDLSSTAMAGGAFCFNDGLHTILGGLIQSENIFGYEIAKNIPIAHCDVTPMELITPLNSDSLTVSDTIKVVVGNNDTIDHFNIPISYVIDGGTVVNDTITDTIPGRSNIIFAFQQPYDFSAPGHEFNIEIYTTYACDTVNTNDTLYATVKNNFDVSAISIDMAPFVCSGITPKATVQNLSTLQTTFDVTMNISGGYTSTKTVTNLAPNATEQVVFDPWNASLGNYNVEVYTTLAPDSVPANDTLTTNVSVGDAVITVNIKTDNYGSEVTWTMTNVLGAIVASGGPYQDTLGGELITTDVCLLSSDCYRFTIYDLSGDGLCCDFGSGNYEIQWNGLSLGVIPGNYTDSANIDLCAPFPIDLGVTSITKPVTSCSLTSAEDVIIKIRNFGTDSVSNFQVSYKLNNEAPVTSAITSTLHSGETINYTFTDTNAANLSNTGNYLIKAYATVISDGNNSNDTTSVTISNVSPSITPYSMGFEQSENFAGWTIENTNNDSTTWVIKPTGGHAGPYVARYAWNKYSAADDWLITKCLNLQAGITYKVSYWYKAAGSSYPESFAVKIGNAPVSTALTTSLASHTNITVTSFTKGGANFTVPADGTYYIGFQCNSAADMWYLYIDDISITDATGINEVADNDQINIYPNPAKDLVNISSSEKISRIKVINAFGQIIISDEVKNFNTSVNTTNLANGMYYLQIETDNGLTTKNITICK